MGCPCGKLSGSDVPSRVSQHKRQRASESVWASLLQDRGSGDYSRNPASGGMEGGSMNQTTSMSEWKTRRDHMDDLSTTDRLLDYYKERSYGWSINNWQTTRLLLLVSSEGLGLIKLFLMNTNNINNHSVNLGNHKSDFEPGLVPKWDRCSNVCWLVPSCHMVLQCALAKQSVLQYLPLIDFSWQHYMVCTVVYLSPQTPQ